MSRNRIQIAVVALVWVLVAAAGSAAGDRKVTIELGDTEGGGISLSLSGKWLNEMVLDAIAKLERGETLELRPQSADEGRYFSYPTDADFAKFEALGYRLFDPGEVSALLARYDSSSGGGGARRSATSSAG